MKKLRSGARDDPGKWVRRIIKECGYFETMMEWFLFALNSLDRFTIMQDWPSATLSDVLLETLSRPLALFIRVYGIYWALSPT
jgi:hypothetical protein